MYGNENISFLNSSNNEKCRKSRSEDRIETLEDDLSTGRPVQRSLFEPNQRSNQLSWFKFEPNQRSNQIFGVTFHILPNQRFYQIF